MSGLRTLGAVATAVLGVAVTLPAQAPAPQAPQATFRSGVDLVDVDVSVLDKDRRPVLGLTAADFTVFEDGKPRPIAAFTPIDLPRKETPDAEWMEMIAPDIATNRVPPEGRLVVIMMDRFIATDQRPIAMEIGEAAIDQLREGDLAAVVFATHGIPQNFTSDRQLRLAAVRRPFATLPEGDAGGAGACSCGACSLETIANVAEGMREVRQRRKVLIIVGSNLSISPMGSCAGSLNRIRDRAIRALESGNITVHAFDPAGLDVPTPGAIAKEPPNYMTLRAAAMRRRGNIGVLPGETGGRVVTGNAPADEIPNVFRESASYYVLGFQPTASASDGKYHHITVKVSRPDVILQARQGYYAPGGRATVATKSSKGVPPALASAVAGVWPKTELGLSMQVVPFALPGLRESEIRITLGASGELTSDPPATTSAEVFVGAFDRNGKSLSDTKQTLSALVRRSITRRGEVEYELPIRLKVKPGRYEVRAAVIDQTLGASGSVYGYVEVPDYTAAPVSLSGILLQAVPESDGAPAEPLPFAPTTRREFSRGERLVAVVREYQGLTQPLQPGYLHVQVLDADNQRVFGQESRILPSQFGADRAADHVVDLPFAHLDPGEYLLTVEVRHGNVEARRDLRFRIR